MSLLRTALYDAHVAMGGRIVPFAGYEMPVQYSSIIAESKAVREGVGMFDVSHMARLRVEGPGALAFLEKITTNDIASLGDGEGQYSLMLNEQGGTVDDLIVFRDRENAYRVVVNASNHEKDVAWMRSHLPADAAMTDETAETVMIAVQGPAAGKLVAGASDRPEAVNAVPFFGSIEMSEFGVPVYATRSGYTGEDGFELVCEADRGPKLWEALASAGATPCGLASRDTLRVEAGLPLYGHELTDEIDPITAGLGWVVSKTKSFIGSEHVAAVREKGAEKKLVGVRLEAKRLIPQGADVVVDGRVVGQIASGVVSPLLDAALGTAFVEPAIKLNTPASVVLRGKEEPATIVNKRFYKRAG